MKTQYSLVHMFGIETSMEQRNYILKHCFSLCMCSTCMHATMFLNAAKNRSKAISVEEFSEHVQRMHADRDKFFELEYNVRMHMYTQSLKAQPGMQM